MSGSFRRRRLHSARRRPLPPGREKSHAEGSNVMFNTIIGLRQPSTRNAGLLLLSILPTFHAILRLILRRVCVAKHSGKCPIAIFCALALVCSAAAQSNPPAPNPCADAHQRELEFWVGEWDLTWPGQNAGEIGHGTNSIKRVMDGCVVEENFSGADSMHLRGKSVSLFDTRTGQWKQTWVDNEGGYLDFVGEFKDGQMILARDVTRPDGTRAKQRMVFKNIAANEFDWSWEA